MRRCEGLVEVWESVCVGQGLLLCAWLGDRVRQVEVQGWS